MKKKDKVLTGEKAKLLSQGCKIKEDIKKLEIKLKAVQKAINLRSSGNFINTSGGKLRIVEKKVMGSICPRELFKYFRKLGTPSKILDVVTVNTTILKTVLSGDVIEDLQDELEPIRSWTWSA